MSVRLALITVIQTQTVPTPWDRLPVPAKLVTKVMECHVQVGNSFTLLCMNVCMLVCVRVCVRVSVYVCMHV